MREVVFRGKRIDNGEWVEGNLFVPDKVDFRKPPTEILMGTNIVRISYEVDPATIGQYTGLKDKNGRRIFEGDIAAKWLSGRRVIYEIKYETDIAAFIGETKKGHFTTFDGDGKYFEIIGNIHDNPELMEVR